jgi:hypothetical protein
MFLSWLYYWKIARVEANGAYRKGFCKQRRPGHQQSCTHKRRVMQIGNYVEIDACSNSLCACPDSIPESKDSLKLF